MAKIIIMKIMFIICVIYATILVDGTESWHFFYHFNKPYLVLGSVLIPVATVIANIKLHST